MNNYFTRIDIDSYIKTTDPNINEQDNEPRGGLEKFWARDNDKLYLIKFCSDSVDNQDLMEFFAHKMLEIIEFPHADVFLGIGTYHNIKKKCCIVECIVNRGKGESLINLVALDHPLKDDPTISGQIQYAYYIFSKLYNISSNDLEKIFNNFLKTILWDAIMLNPDRHLLNIGIIYNEESKKYFYSPLFDHGYCFDVDLNKSCMVGNKNFNNFEIINYVINNYYENIEEMYNQIITKYSEENITQILNSLNFLSLTAQEKLNIQSKILRNVAYAQESKKALINKS